MPESLQKLCYEGGMLVNFRVRPWTKALLPFFYLSQIWASLRLCRQLKPDLIHTHSLLPQGLTGCLLSCLCRLPHITTSHGNDVFGLKQSGLMGALKRRVVRSADAVTANSTATQDALRQLGAPSKNLALIPAFANQAPIDWDLVQALKTESGQAPRLLFVGRLIEEKGIDVLIRSLPAVLERVPELQCYFLGDGALRKDMEALVESLGLDASVHFMNWRPRDEVSSWMASADVLVVPSLPVGTWQEAQGLVVVEAMLARTPVIASRIGGIPDMIEDGVTGRLVEPGNVSALSESILEMLSDQASSAEFVAAAEMRAKRLYASDAVSALLEGLYHEVLQKEVSDV